MKYELIKEYPYFDVYNVYKNGEYLYTTTLKKDAAPKNKLKWDKLSQYQKIMFVRKALLKGITYETMSKYIGVNAKSIYNYNTKGRLEQYGLEKVKAKGGIC